MNTYTTAQQHLTEADPLWATLIAQHGPCTLTPQPQRSPYEALIRAIAHQQLHGKAAETIIARFLALHPATPFPTPHEVLATPYEALRGVGFSHNKVLSIQDIALKTTTSLVPTRPEAEALSNAALIERLTPLRGVGVWTVEMFLIFTLGRLNIFPLDDYGVQVGFAHSFNGTGKPPRALMIEKSTPWAPYGAVAAWYFWQVANSLKKKHL